MSEKNTTTPSRASTDAHGANYFSRQARLVRPPAPDILHREHSNGSCISNWGERTEGEELTFCHFDEFEDAVLSVELAAEKFSDVQNSPTLWKWVIIAMQNAVQSAMVLALAGTDGCGALFPKSQKQSREWLQNPTPNRPRRQMADYDTLLAWIQRAELLEGPVPPLSEGDCQNLKRLNQLRRQFAHYNPTGWGIELQYMLNIIPVAADVFEHLTTTQGRPNIHFTADQKRRMRRSLAGLRAVSSLGDCQALTDDLGA